MNRVLVDDISPEITHSLNAYQSFVQNPESSSLLMTKTSFIKMTSNAIKVERNKNEKLNSEILGTIKKIETELDKIRKIASNSNFNYEKYKGKIVPLPGLTFEKISTLDSLNIQNNSNILTVFDYVNIFVNSLVKKGYIKNTEDGNDKAVLSYGVHDHDHHVHVSNRTTGLNKSKVSEFILNKSLNNVFFNASQYNADKNIISKGITGGIELDENLPDVLVEDINGAAYDANIKVLFTTAKQGHNEKTKEGITSRHFNEFAVDINTIFIKNDEEKYVASKVIEGASEFNKTTDINNTSGEINFQLYKEFNNNINNKSSDFNKLIKIEKNKEKYSEFPVDKYFWRNLQNIHYSESIYTLNSKKYNLNFLKTYVANNDFNEKIQKEIEIENIKNISDCVYLVLKINTSMSFTKENVENINKNDFNLPNSGNINVVKIYSKNVNMFELVYNRQPENIEYKVFVNDLNHVLYDFIFTEFLEIFNINGKYVIDNPYKKIFILLSKIFNDLECVDNKGNYIIQKKSTYFDIFRIYIGKLIPEIPPVPNEMENKLNEKIAIFDFFIEYLLQAFYIYYKYIGRRIDIKKIKYSIKSFPMSDVENKTSPIISERYFYLPGRPYLGITFGIYDNFKDFITNTLGYSVEEFDDVTSNNFDNRKFYTDKDANIINFVGTTYKFTKEDEKSIIGFYNEKDLGKPILKNETIIFKFWDGKIPENIDDLCLNTSKKNQMYIKSIKISNNIDIPNILDPIYERCEYFLASGSFETGSRDIVEKNPIVTNINFIYFVPIRVLDEHKEDQYVLGYKFIEKNFTIDVSSLNISGSDTTLVDKNSVDVESINKKLDTFYTELHTNLENMKNSGYLRLITDLAKENIIKFNKDVIPYVIDNFNDKVISLGQIPKPYIISVSIEIKSTIGVLRTASISMKAFSLNQLYMISVLYMRPGVSILLEWGNSNYYNNEGEFVNNDKNIDLFEEKLKYNKIKNNIKKNIKETFGNYDAMFGKIYNFKWNFEQDGSIIINLNLVSSATTYLTFPINKKDSLTNFGEVSIRINNEIEMNKSEGYLTLFSFLTILNNHNKSDLKIDTEIPIKYRYVDILNKDLSSGDTDIKFNNNEKIENRNLLYDIEISSEYLKNISNSSKDINELIKNLLDKINNAIFNFLSLSIFMDEMDESNINGSSEINVKNFIVDIKYEGKIDYQDKEQDAINKNYNNTFMFNLFSTGSIISDLRFSSQIPDSFIQTFYVAANPSGLTYSTGNVNNNIEKIIDRFSNGFIENSMVSYGDVNNEKFERSIILKDLQDIAPVLTKIEAENNKNLIIKEITDNKEIINNKGNTEARSIFENNLELYYNIILKENNTNGNEKYLYLPIGLTLGFNLHGISGLKWGDLFKIDYLPLNFRDCIFQINKISEEINEGLWKTKIEALLRYSY